MISIKKCNQLIAAGFSLVTVGNSKIANFPWKKNQTTPHTKESFLKNFDYKSGIFRKDKSEIPATEAVAIVTGYGDLECIDIDLKVFPTTEEMETFWNELISLLQDHIFDFDEKFVIYKTRNAGYHILYKSKKVKGNTKIAVLKEYKEAILESRGKGGYIFVYQKSLNKRTYLDIDYISDEDHEILWGLLEIYNYKQEVIPVKEKQIIAKSSYSSGLKPWEDFNEKTEVIDLISGEFEIIKNLTDKYIIKRNGAKSPHSGYIYKDSDSMYLFSTGTIYPNEQLLSSYAVYTYKEHSGDFSESASALYKQGFGARQIAINPFPVNISKPEIKEEDIEFPIDIFPKDLQFYILKCNETLSSSVDYMGGSLIWLISVMIGNSLTVEVKTGWRELCNVWICLVGRPGIGKTPSMSNIKFPLSNINFKEIKSYMSKSEKYENYQKLDKQEKKLVDKVFKPKNSQFIANDITLEALVELHAESKNAVGFLKDELAGWMKDMNKYRVGSDMEFWLSSWAGETHLANRKTAKSCFVKRPHVPVLGGIQPGILNNFYTDENKDSGFLDRILLVYPEMEVPYYDEKEMTPDLLEWYDDYVIRFHEYIKNRVLEKDKDGEIVSKVVKLSSEAKEEWQRINDEITDLQNSEHENEYMKSMLSKQKGYILRFSLIINTLFHHDSNGDQPLDIVAKSSILKAEKLSKYFIFMGKKVKANAVADNELKTSIEDTSKLSKYEQFKAIYKNNPEVNKTKLSEKMNMSRTHIYRYIDKFKKESNGT